MAFNFGFASDDIEEDEDDSNEQTVESATLGTKNGNHVDLDLLPPKLHTLEEMLSTLPDQITYTSYPLHSPSNPTSNPTNAPSPSSPSEATLSLPRRDIHDIRAQILAESDLSYSPTSTALTEGLSSDDIKPRLYEGGFKTWECAVDLARYLHGLLSRKELDLKGMRVVELGAGTALPTSLLVHHLASSPLSPFPSPSTSPEHSDPPTQPTTFLLADYNFPVLTHASIPNLLLAYLFGTETAGAQQGARSTVPLDSSGGEFETSEMVRASMLEWTQRRDIGILGVEGAWGKDFLDVVRGQQSSLMYEQGSVMGGMAERTRKSKRKTLILTSETIYQPATLPAFVETLFGLLEDGEERGGEAVALVAAKKVYFGVGGGIDEFVGMLGEMSKGRERGAGVRKAWDSNEDEEGEMGRGGVGRCILEVRLEGDRSGRDAMIF